MTSERLRVKPGGSERLTLCRVSVYFHPNKKKRDPREGEVTLKL